MNSETMLPLTDDAKEVFQHARTEAERFSHGYIDSAHVLLGIAKQNRGSGCFLLRTFDIDLRKVRVEVTRLIEPGDGHSPSSEFPETPRAAKMRLYASEEARKLDHDTIGPLHLLLGICREQESVAAQVLMNLGVSFDALSARAHLYLTSHPNISLPCLWLMRLKVALGSRNLAMGDEEAIRRATLLIEELHASRKKYTL